MIEFDEYKIKLNNLRPALDALGASLKLDDAQRELEELRAATEAPAPTAEALFGGADVCGGHAAH